jgi:hypothetical protein
MLAIPYNIYNWLESFFIGHSHRTKFSGEVSDFHSISASIIQGSAIGPASYVINASDLHPVAYDNVMDKYADDTYLIIPASNNQFCATEIVQVEK